MKPSSNLSFLCLMAANLLLGACERPDLILNSGLELPVTGAVQATDPVIEHIWPTRGEAGTLVHLYGKRFSLNADDNLIWFGDIEATPVAVISSMELLVTVPAKAETGPIRLVSNGKACTGPSFTLTPKAKRVKPAGGYR